MLSRTNHAVPAPRLHAHQVDEANAVLLQRFKVAWQVAPCQDAAVHSRVQRLDAPCRPHHS